jgi:16S rRNA (cytidine1402-2'-O)-methyltransferase
MFEETVRGSLKEVKSYYESHTLKGEFVVIIGGKEGKKNVNKKENEL